MVGVNISVLRTHDIRWIAAHCCTSALLLNLGRLDDTGELLRFTLRKGSELANRHAARFGPLL